MTSRVPRVSSTSVLIEDEQAGVLRVVQPALTASMDGSISTLAPGFATKKTETVFLVELAAAVGAGGSMVLSKGLLDDGEPTGRGKPVFRGILSGFELIVFSYPRHPYRKPSFVGSLLQVLLGGCLCLPTGC